MDNPQAVIEQLIKNGARWLVPEEVRAHDRRFIEQCKAFTQAMKDACLTAGEAGATFAEFGEAWKAGKK